MRKTTLAKVAGVSLGAAFAVASASAQTCGEQWLPGGAAPSGFETACMAWWDSDGPGPQEEQVIIGTIDSQGVGARVLRWSENQWQALGGYFSSTVSAVLVCDLDGDGPLGEEVIAAGTFTDLGSTTLNYIARWDGQQWQPIGSGLGGPVTSLAYCDLDGEGPQVGRLVAAGSFTTAGSVPANRVASWDGSAWAPIGQGFNSTVAALCTWDPDGAGPQAQVLIAGGSFTSSGISPISRIGRWDGSTWRAFSSGVNAPVTALGSWDPDGVGPANPRLIVSGLFSAAGQVSATRMAQWTGSSWQPLGGGLANAAYAVAVHDPLGDGGRLVVAGAFSTAGDITVNRIAAWDGSSWQAMGAGVDSTARALLEVPPEAGLAERGEVLVGGLFQYSGGHRMRGIGIWDESEWWPLSVGLTEDIFDERVRSFTTWDPDDSGPLPARLVASGFFATIGSTPVNHVAAWDGHTWSALGEGLPSQAYRMVNWDPDREGPQPSHVVAAGFRIDSNNTPRDAFVRAWDGWQWRSLGEVSGQAQVWAMTVWDPDGTGAQIILAGKFTSVGGVAANSVARWDGAAWHPLGAGIPPEGVVDALATWDPDGDGPQSSVLVAGGAFQSAGAVAASNVAVWDGTAWSALGEGTDRAVWGLTAWDPDDSGPAPPQLIAGGWFTTAGGQVARKVAGWNGQNWYALGEGLNGDVFCVDLWDADGPGPLPSVVVAGGDFTASGEAPMARIARWDGTAWRPFGLGVTHRVRAFGSWDGDGSGPGGWEFLAGGDFVAAGPYGARYFARWSADPKPWAVTPQVQLRADPSSIATLWAAPATGYAEIPGNPVSFQWHRNGTPVVDGPGGASAGGGVVTGSAGEQRRSAPAAMVITDVHESDAGEYTLVIANSCGEVSGRVVSLTVGPACDPDVNCDGLVNGYDVEAMERAVNGDRSDFCQNDADYNGDGAVNGFDVEAVEQGVNGAPCP